MFLEEVKYIVKEKKVPEYITSDDFCDDSDSEDSDEENSSEENSDEGTSNEENKYRMCSDFIFKAFRVISSDT